MRQKKIEGTFLKSFFFPFISSTFLYSCFHLKLLMDHLREGKLQIKIHFLCRMSDTCDAVP